MPANAAKSMSTLWVGKRERWSHTEGVAAELWIAMTVDVFGRDFCVCSSHLGNCSVTGHPVAASKLIVASARLLPALHKCSMC